MREPSKLLLFLLIPTVVACSDVAAPPFEAASLTEGVTFSQRSVDAGESHRLGLILDADSVVQLRIWSVGLLFGIQARLESPAGDVLWEGRSAGAELQVPAVRVDQTGRYVLHITWEEGSGLASYRYDLLNSEPAEVSRPWVGLMTNARAGHTATRLADGRVLVVGGHPSGSGQRPGLLAPVISAELVDPTSGAVERVGDLAQPRAYHAAALIIGGAAQYAGKVLVAGGLGDRGEALLTTEIYDPITGKFTPGPLLPEPRAFLQALAITGTGSFLDNKVVLAGGERTRRGPQHDRGSKTYQEIDENPRDLWYFDPDSGQIVAWEELSQGRVQLTMTLLSDGRLMFVGGGVDTLPSLPGCQQNDQNICHCSGPNVPLCTEFLNCGDEGCQVKNYTRKDRGTRRVEVYDTSVGSMTILNSQLNRGRLGHTASLLPDDRVLIAGGATAMRRSFHASETGLPEYPSTLDSVEMYDPVTNAFQPLPPLTIAREQHAAVTLEGGLIALVGGIRPVPGSTEAVRLIDVWNPVRRQFLPADLLSVGYGAPAVVVTQDGRGIIVTGGENAGEPLPQLERVDLLPE